MFSCIFDQINAGALMSTKDLQNFQISFQPQTFEYAVYITYFISVS